MKPHRGIGRIDVVIVWAVAAIIIWFLGKV